MISVYPPGNIERWRRGQVTRPPAPLAARSRRYRQILHKLIARYVGAKPIRIISVGAGAGVFESELAGIGHGVTALDNHPEALEVCRKAGLDTIYYDISRPPSGLGEHDCVYVDGVLGHFHPEQTLPNVFIHLAQLCSPGGYLVISNDLADHDQVFNFTTAQFPDSRFYRPPAHQFGAWAEASRYWRICRARPLLYHRPTRGMRRREVVVMRRVTDGQTDGRAEPE